MRKSCARKSYDARKVVSLFRPLATLFLQEGTAEVEQGRAVRSNQEEEHAMNRSLCVNVEERSPAVLWG